MMRVVVLDDHYIDQARELLKSAFNYIEVLSLDRITEERKIGIIPPNEAGLLTVVSTASATVRHMLHVYVMAGTITEINKVRRTAPELADNIVKASSGYDGVEIHIFGMEVEHA